MHPSLPADLLESLETVPGFDRGAFEQIHQSGAQVVSIRINPLKHTRSDDLFSGENLPIQSSKIPWSSEGYYLSHRPNFTLDPLIHAGAYYVQEASSMFLEEAMRQCIDLSRPFPAWKIILISSSSMRLAAGADCFAANRKPLPNGVLTM